jgi:enoyl-CoA hydratase
MPIICSRPAPGVALLTVSNPRRRNALAIEDFQQLAVCWLDLEADASLRCVVLTGEGDAAFCSGAQLDVDFTLVEDIDDLVDRALQKTRVFPRPGIAAINGHCVAGGFELMLSSDLRVASEAALLGLPEVRWGIVPSGGGAMKLREQIGHARAMQLLLTGQLVSAREALALGIVNEVVAAAKVLPRALELAAAIARNSPLAVMHTKRLALQAGSREWQQREHAEREAARLVRASEDNERGRAAFLSKSQPQYD